MKIAERAAAVAALGLAAAALAVSLLHAGPPGPAGARGPAGPAGQAGRDARLAHLGLCDNGMAASIYEIVLTPPVLEDGVPSCPNGSFVPVVPQAQP